MNSSRSNSNVLTRQKTKASKRQTVTKNLSFQESLLQLMDQKDHSSYWTLMGPEATKQQLLLHYQQEWEVYVRDFPLFLARLLAKNPPADVRQDLAENFFEEETGKLSLGVPHPELFLRMMEGLGFRRSQFEKVKLLPAAKAYRAWIDDLTKSNDWLTGVAVVTIFIEGSRKDRLELERKKPATLPIEEQLKKHPLVIHQGLDPKYMDLQRAHFQAESGHRAAAWRMILNHASTAAVQNKIQKALSRSLKLWSEYRSAVAKACELN